MGLTSWKGSRVRQQDVTVAKNYLSSAEIDGLNRIVVMYLDYAEDMARRRNPMTMREWETKLDAFLQFNERDVLNHAGRISAEVAEKLALERYAEFDANRRETERLVAETEDAKAVQQLERDARRGTKR